MIAYKLTNQDGETRPGDYNETQWGEGVEHTVYGGKPSKCGEGWLHAYHSPAMAAMMNATHAQIGNPVCWECEADVAEDLGDMLLCTQIKTLRRVNLPTLIPEQRVEIAIRAAMSVYDESSWMEWSRSWLSGDDRSKEAALQAVEQVAAARVAAASKVQPTELQLERPLRVARQAATEAATAAALLATEARVVYWTAAFSVGEAAWSRLLSKQKATKTLNDIINDVLQKDKQR